MFLLPYHTRHRFFNYVRTCLDSRPGLVCRGPQMKLLWRASCVRCRRFLPWVRVAMSFKKGSHVGWKSPNNLRKRMIEHSYIVVLERLDPFLCDLEGGSSEFLPLQWGIELTWGFKYELDLNMSMYHTRWIRLESSVHVWFQCRLRDWNFHRYSWRCCIIHVT